MVHSIPSTDKERSEVSTDVDSMPDTEYLLQPSICILALYQFVAPTVSQQTVEQWKYDIESFLRKFQARGSLLLAVEGINGTICFQQKHADTVEYFLRDIFPWLKTRRSYSADMVYHRLKVRIKKEIVTMGSLAVAAIQSSTTIENNVSAETLLSPNHSEAIVLRPVRTGQYVKPGPEWDSLIHDPDCLVIDTRNKYEVELGTFQGAINPNTSEFPEFPSWLENQLKQRQHCSKIAMFCTGGIRCEKATAYCLDLLSAQKTNEQQRQQQDLPAVYHLEGGILAYLDAVPKEKSTFHGECFVFDKRTAVTHGLRPSETYTVCHACRHPVRKDSDTFQEGIYCPNCVHDEQRRRERYSERQKQIELLAEQGTFHLHDPKERKQQQI